MDLGKAKQMAQNGIHNPDRAVLWVLSKLYPSKFRPQQIRSDGVVTWNTRAGFRWGDGNSPPQISAINYHIIQALRDDLRGNQYHHAIELGCGYGRVTPWLSEFAETVTGVDPNKKVLSCVDDYYPEVNTLQAKGQSLPLSDDSIDLVFTRNVLQHIPNDEVEIVASEIKRVATSDAHILVCEGTNGEEKQTLHPRSVERYTDLFSPFSLERNWSRDAPAKSRKHGGRRLLFAGN